MESGVRRNIIRTSKYFAFKMLQQSSQCCFYALTEAVLLKHVKVVKLSSTQQHRHV